MCLVKSQNKKAFFLDCVVLVHQPRVSQGGHTGSTQGLPVRPPWEEWTKHDTKPRRNLGNVAFFNSRIFVP